MALGRVLVWLQSGGSPQAASCLTQKARAGSGEPRWNFAKQFTRLASPPESQCTFDKRGCDKHGTAPARAILL